MIGVIAAAVFWTKTVTVNLDHASWERSIKIDAFLPRRQADWCDSMPSDGYGVARSQSVWTLKAGKLLGGAHRNSLKAVN